MLTEVTEARAKVGQINVNADDAGVAGAVPAGAGRAAERAGAPAGGQRELSATSRPTRTSCDLQAQLEGTENRITVGAQPLHPDGAGLQHLHPPVPAEPHRDDVRLQAEAELHRRERSADPGSADGRFRPAGRRRRRPRSRRPQQQPAPANGDRRRIDPRCGRCCARLLLRGVALALLLLACALAQAQQLAPIPPLDSPVVDTTGTLDAAHEAGARSAGAARCSSARAASCRC